VRRIALPAAAITIAAATLVGGAMVAPAVVLRTQLPSAVAAAAAIATSWRPTGPTTGGYAKFRSLDPEFDLYATAWTLRVLRIYDVPLPAAVDRGETAAALQAALTDHTTIRPVPHLEVIRLAVGALRDLRQQPSADVVAREVAAQATAGGFSFEAGGPATIAAGAAAIEALTESAAPLNDDLKNVVRSWLDQARRPAALREFAEITLPAWHAADLALPASDRAPFRDGLAEQLNIVWTSVKTIDPWEAPILSLVADARQVAIENGLQVPKVDERAWRALERDDGFLQLAPAATEPDYQTTATAALLGRQMPPALGRSIAASAASDGWHDGRVDPATSAMAERLLGKLLMPTHRDEVARQAPIWLDEVQTAVAGPALLRSGLGELAGYNWLAATVGGSPWLPSVDRQAININDWNRSEKVLLARALLEAHVPPSGDLARALTEGLDRTPTTIDDALAMTVIGQLTGNDALIDRARVFTSQLGQDGLYRAEPTESTPDLRSTAIAYAIRNETSIGAARRFATPRGFSMLPDTGSTEAGTILSAYLAVGLASGFDSPAAIP
jgi:hypothetical protein